MIKNNRVFELKIEEDDELSGIDSISLVDEPAIEIGWMAFNRIKGEDFHIPDGEDEKYLEKLVSIAQDEQELFDEGWVVSKIQIVGESEFVSTNPNGPSEEDEKEYNVRYKYILNPKISQSAIIPTTRDFCKTLINRNYVWRIEDMDSTQNDFGQSAMVWRGGYNCRHVWARIEYKKDATIINKASVNKGKVTVGGFPTDLIPDIRVLGIEQPNTTTNATLANPKPSTVKNLGLSKQGFKPGVPHYTKDGKLYEGPTHKGADGRLMTGAVHTEDSEYLYHEDELAEVGPRGGIKESDKAPKSDTPNKDPKGEGTAKGDASGKRGAKVTAEVEKTLQKKVDEFNEKESNTKYGNATLGALKSVYQRGLGAYNTSHSPLVKSAEQWAYARVNAFLYLLKNGRPENPKYDTDYDLLGSKHPKADMSSEKFIECKECGHSWDMEDGGDDMYTCHKCGYDNKEQFGYDNPLPSYVDEVSGDTISKSLVKPTMFDSYSDYPDSVKNNAKAVLKYVDENGWGSCGTPVGKQRANDLAQGNPVSLDTVKRMYSYLSRHKVDLESSKGYGDGCGKLMYDSWGGLSALSWAESKINQEEKMSKQSFQTDDEKKIVLGPAMIPDFQIFRKDGMGNPYYVYFTAKTIKMICDKYMRNKYTDNNDEMHNGKAVKDVYVVESWIKESENDKSTDYGYSDLPIGTWFVSMKVNNPETWAKVKEGFLNGFSVSGYFEEVAQFCMEEMFLKQVVEILNNIED